MNPGAKAPPTARQVEAFQMVALHRSVKRAAPVLGIREEVVYAAVKGFLRRCRHYTTPEQPA